MREPPDTLRGPFIFCISLPAQGVLSSLIAGPAGFAHIAVGNAVLIALIGKLLMADRAGDCSDAGHLVAVGIGGVAYPVAKRKYDDDR